MSIREKIVENSSVSIGVATVLIVVAAIALFSQSRSTSKVVAASEARAFYSDDLGATWFADATDKVVPYTRNGKEVCRAFIFKPESGGPEFVGYLLRYSPAGVSALERAQATRAAAEKAIKAAPGGGKDGNYTLPPIPFEDMRLQEVKAPGTGGTWVPYTDARAQSILMVKGPGGATALPVLP